AFISFIGFESSPLLFGLSVLRSRSVESSAFVFNSIGSFVRSLLLLGLFVLSTRSVESSLLVSGFVELSVDSLSFIGLSLLSTRSVERASTGVICCRISSGLRSCILFESCCLLGFGIDYLSEHHVVFCTFMVWRILEDWLSNK